MTYYAALDVSLRSTHACVINEAGEIVAEGKVDSEAADIVSFLDELEIDITKVGLEAGTLTQYLTYGLPAPDDGAGCRLCHRTDLQGSRRRPDPL